MAGGSPDDPHRPATGGASARAQRDAPQFAAREGGRASVVGPFAIAALLIGIALFFFLRGEGRRQGGPDPEHQGREAALPERPAPSPEGGPAAAEPAGAGGEAPTPAKDAEAAAAPGPGGAVEGTVRVRGSGDPAPGLAIVARPEVPGRGEGREALFKAPRLQEGDRSAESDGAGRYRIGDLAAGSYRVFALRGKTDFVGVPPARGMVVHIGPEAGAQVDFELSLGGVIYGRILDPDEKPLAGAEVAAVPTDLLSSMFDTVHDSQKAEPVKSGEDGSYRIAGLPLRKHYQVTARLEGWAPSEPADAAPTEEDREVDLDLTLLRGSTVSGSVVDPAGAPIPEAEVRVVSEEPTDLSVHSSSSGSGDFEFKHLRPGGYRLVAEARGFKESTHDLNCDGETDLTSLLLVLERGSSTPGGISGRVDDDEGAAVEGASLKLVGFSPGKGPFMADATSAGDGRFAFEGVPAGAYNLLVASERHAPLLKQGVAAGGEPLLLTLKRAARVRGKVVDRATGEALAGATVQVTSADGAADDLSMFMTGQAPPKEAGISSGAGGTFLLDKATPGRVRVRAAAGGYGPGLSEEFDLAPGREVAGVVVALSSGGTIAGTVFAPDGARAGAAVVSAREASSNPLAAMMPGVLGPGGLFTATADDDGVFRIEHLPQGKLVLTATHPAYGPALDEVVLGLDEVRERVQIRLKRSATVRIRVREKDQPRPGMTLQLLGKGPMKMATSGADGSAAFEGLSPGEYLLQILDMLQLMGGKGMGFRQRVFRLAEGEEAELEIVLGTGATVHGTVAGGAAGPMGIVVLRRPDAIPSEEIDPSSPEISIRAAEGNVALGMVAQDGSYTLLDVPDGEFLIEVSRMPVDWTQTAKAPPSERKPLYREKLRVEDGKDLEWNINLRGKGKSAPAGGPPPAAKPTTPGKEPGNP